MLKNYKSEYIYVLARTITYVIYIDIFALAIIC